MCIYIYIYIVEPPVHASFRGVTLDKGAVVVLCPSFDPCTSTRYSIEHVHVHVQVHVETYIDTTVYRSTDG